MAVIRGTSLLGFAELVAQLGADPDPLLRRAGIAPDDAGRFDAFLTYASLIRVLESAAEATDRADFGRLLAQRHGIEILGPVGVAARTAGSVAAAFTIFEKYLGAYSSGLTARIHPLPDQRFSFVELRLLIPHPPAHPQTTELSLGATLQVLRFLLGAGYAPLSVHLPHEALTSRDDYLHYFSCTPRFGEPRAGFTILTADLDHPLVDDEHTHRAMLGYLDTVIDRTAPGVTTSVRELVRQLLPTMSATLPVVADQFGLHPKALQRLLADEGTNFLAVVDDVRREMAQRYLRDTDVTLSHLAHELGYAEQSVFSRSCQRWFGSSPARLRKQWRTTLASSTADHPA